MTAGVARVDELDAAIAAATPPLDGPLEVAAQDPVTRDRIRVQVDATGAVVDISHPNAVLSFLRPDRPWDDDVVVSFCHYVLLVGDMDAARRWSGEHAGTFTIGLDEATELARRHVQRTFALVLPDHV